MAIPPPTASSHPEIAKPMPIFGGSTLFPSALLPSMMRSLILPFPSNHFGSLIHEHQLPFLQIPKLADPAAFPHSEISQNPQPLTSLTSLINPGRNEEIITKDERRMDDGGDEKRIKMKREEGQVSPLSQADRKRMKIEMEEREEGQGLSPHSQSSSIYSPSQESTPQPSPSRKPSKAIPDEKKDRAYFERRRKNNDAAKRSRDLRRQKEEAIALKASTLEQDNQLLRKQISLLKTEITKLHLLLFAKDPQKVENK